MPAPSIRAGRTDATIAQNPREMGRLAIISAYKILHGETVPAEQPVRIELIARARANAKQGFGGKHPI